MMRTGKIAFRAHCVLATVNEFSQRPFHASAMTMVRLCHGVGDSITLLTRSIGSLHVGCKFAAGSRSVYVMFSKNWIQFLKSALMFQLRNIKYGGIRYKYRLHVTFYTFVWNYRGIFTPTDHMATILVAIDYMLCHIAWLLRDSLLPCKGRLNNVNLSKLERRWSPVDFRFRW